MPLLEALQGCERLGYPVQASLIGGDKVQNITVLGRQNRQRFGRGERFDVAASLA
jgi:hypothetical protein